MRVVIGARRGSPLLAVALLSASGVIISTTSIARFLHAGHSSVGRLAGPAARLLALAGLFLLPAAAALYAGHERLALMAATMAIAGYYVVVLRSDAASRILHLRMDPSAAGPV